MPDINPFQKIFRILLAEYGPQSWWPADTPFEVMVGAILTQNTSWAGVEKAIANLKVADALSSEAILEMDLHDLEQVVRPSGYFRQKAERLKMLSCFLLDEHGNDIPSMSRLPTDALREQLLALKGVGPETADSILLYALGHPAFVIDAYTVRLFSRMGLCDEYVKYHDLQAHFMDNLDKNAAFYNEYHALIVTHSKRTCTKRAPRCGGCPLLEMCAWGSKNQDPKPKIEPKNSC